MNTERQVGSGAAFVCRKPFERFRVNTLTQARLTPAVPQKSCYPPVTLDFRNLEGNQSLWIRSFNLTGAERECHQGEAVKALAECVLHPSCPTT